MNEQPSNFAASAGHPVARDPEHWCYGPLLRTRDSGPLEISNAEVLLKALRREGRFEGDWRVTRSGDWGCGWVEHLAFKALTKKGRATRLYAWLYAWFGRLADYPVADDTDHSRRKHEATCENISFVGRGLVSPFAQTEWAARVFTWLWENDQAEVSPRDDGGGAPSREAVTKALKALGWYDPDIDEDEEEEDT